MPPKVVIIGLDGATFALLKPWMEAGKLPYLQSLMAQGVRGPLSSSIPPVTAPAWQCFMTGKNPGKHGVAWFLRRKPNSYEETLVDSTSCDGKTFWELLSEEGKRVAILNLPFTDPPRKIHGVMISGFTTPPSRREDFTYPRELLKEIEETFGPYQTHLKTLVFALVHRVEAAIEGFLSDCRELTDYQFQVAQYLLERDAFDFLLFYQFTPDRIQHLLWYILDPTHPWYDQGVAGRYSDKIVDYYSHLDRHIAGLAEKVGEDSTILVISDHGFGPVHRWVDVNAWLLQEGYIRIRRHPLSQFRLLLWKLGWDPELFNTFVKKLLQWKMVQRWIVRAASSGIKAKWAGRSRRKRRKGGVPFLFLSLKDIEWSRTKAYCLSGVGMLRINLQGRDPQGAVPREEYNALRDELVAKLKGFVDPTTGQKVNAQVFVKEELYHGRYLEEMPDIIYLPLEDRYLAGNPMAFYSSRIVADSGISGMHRMDGILIAKGRPIKQGATIEGATLMDIAPTVLYLMGSRIPQDMDGRVLTELFEEEFLKEHPIVYAEAAPEVEGQPVELSAEDQEAVLERLKGLGYID